MEWEFFYRQLEAGAHINETCFLFSDDPTKQEHYLGYLPHNEAPYWVGYCDIAGGCDFQSAAALVSAPIFGGRSLKERWDTVIIQSVQGLPLEDWQTHMDHV